MATRKTFGIGTYRDDDSRRQGCRPVQRNFLIVCERIKANTYDAIERARRLAERWNATPPHAACPCTMVGPLVEDLLKYT